jgi:hypothetical protein
MAMSLPLPIAMPSSVCARAALSLIPSPSMATFYTAFCRLITKSLFEPGSMAA